MPLLALLLPSWQTSAATKAVGDPPVIDEQPIGRQATEGGHATLSILAHGTGPLTYQWLKGSTMLTNSARLTGATNAVLNIDPVLVADSSNYTVVVTAGNASITSAPVSLVVARLVISNPVPSGTGAVVHLFGQIGDVYRVELNVNFGAWKTNGYATNRTGHTEHFDNGVGGGIRQFRAAVDRLLPVLYPSNATSLRAYGKLNQVWRFQGTTNFLQWDDLLTVTNMTGWTRFNDNSPASARRFYRISPP